MFDWFTGTKRPSKDATPGSQEEVQAALLALNRSDAPFVVRDGAPENVDLVCEWRILDPEWYEYFDAVGLSRTFQIHMRFNSAKKQVRSVDKMRTVRWAAGVPAIAPSKEVQRGQSNQVEFVATFEKDENGKTRKVAQNTFSATELKNPLRDAVTAEGWTWRGIYMGRL